MATITNLFQLGLWPEATLSDVGRGPNFLLELSHGVELMATSSVSEHVRQSPCCWLRTRVSGTSLQVTAWIWLITTLVGIIPADPYHRVSFMIYSVPLEASAAHPVMGVSCSLDWTGRRDWWAKALVDSGLWLATGMDGQSTAPTADTAFLSSQHGGPLAALTFRCAAGRSSLVSCFLRLRAWVQKMGAQLKCQWPGYPMTGRTGGGDADSTCTGMLIDAGAVVPLSSGVVSSIGASTLGCMIAVSASLTEHVGPASGLGSGREKPWKKPHQVYPDLSERGPSWRWCPSCLAILVHPSSCF